MFDTLLESKGARSGSAGGAFASVTAHSALIAAAVWATAQATVQTAKPAEHAHVVYFPPTPIVASLRNPAKSPSQRAPTIPAPIQVSTPVSKLPPVDFGGIASLPGQLTSPPIPMAASVGRPGAGVTDSGGVFSENEVEKPASMIAGSAAPRYPETLRSSGVEGKVVALFVVDEAGRAEVDSVRFVRSDNRLFEDAVRVALRRMRFVPAEAGGRKVRQLVQMPFVFTIDR